MSQKLFGEVSMELEENNKYKVLERYHMEEYGECRKLIIPEVKKDIDEAIKNDDFELLYEAWAGVAATNFQNDIRRYLENQLPDDNYFNSIQKEIEKYKFDIGDRVLREGNREKVLGEIIKRQGGRYEVETKNGSQPLTFYAREYELELV